MTSVNTSYYLGKQESWLLRTYLAVTLFEAFLDLGVHRDHNVDAPLILLL